MAKRIFLGANTPLPAAIAAGLAALKPVRLPDFGKILLVLPGKVARSNVRKELLYHFPDGIFLPELLTPHLLMHYQRQAAALPSATAEELLWSKVLMRAAAHPEEFPEIFPAGKIPPENFSAAGKLRQLRNELAAGGFSIADAANFLGSRGNELSRLEFSYCRELANCDLTDPLENDRQAAQDSAAFAGVEKIILAGLPDVPRMLQQKLALIDEAYPGSIEIWIADNEEKADYYNEWGVPVTEKWLDVALKCDIENIHTAIDPADGARRAMLLAAPDQLFDPDECAIVLADQSLYGDFAQEFAHLKNSDNLPVTVADPSGVPLGSLRLCRLGKTLLDYLENNDDFLYASLLIREEDFLHYVAGTPEKRRGLLKQLDDFSLNMMADNFDHALGYLEDTTSYALLKKALGQISFWRKHFELTAPGEFIREFFTAIYHDRRDLSPVNGVTFDRECEVFTEILTEFTALPPELLRGIDRIDLLKVFFRNCRNEKIIVAPEPGTLYFEGRLEMPFLTQKRLIFCGMNDKFFPDRIDLTPFLTDSIRRKIGIRSNLETLVRSMCHLQSVINTRTSGDVHILVLRTDSEKSALRPSGMFFGGDLPETDLLARCSKLFRDPEVIHFASAPAGDKEFFLKARLDFKRDTNGLMKLAVTDLDTYLRSPFEFWWERIMQMGSTDYSLCEPEAALSGTLCHEAFEKLPLHRRFPSEEALEKALHANFDETLARRFGSPLPVLLKLYANNMKQRLTYGAHHLFKSQQEGFELLAAEYKLGGTDGFLLYEGAVFRGKVDRIEYNRQKNILRVIDIKTGKVDNVITEHCRFDRKKQFNGFKRIQLPAYVLLLKNDPAFRELCPFIDSASVECAYLALPAEVTASSLDMWDAEHLENILPEVREEIIRIIREISQMPQQQLYGHPERITMPLLQPDTLHALRGFQWLEPEKPETAAEKPQKAEKTEKSSSKAKQQPTEIVPLKPFPALPKLNAPGTSRCCDCPPDIQSQCCCRNGDCSSCRCFNGFKSFNIITASAGTGKTYSLASRFIQLLDYGAEPESILAITFTKKAAGEIFDRIVRRICELVLKPDNPANHCLRMDNQRVIALIRKLLGNQVKELQISTIDSFFMQLLQAFAPELGIWGDINMIDEDDDRMLRHTIHRWIRSIHDEEQLNALRELLKEASSGDSDTIHSALYKLTGKVHHFYQLKMRPGADGSLPQLDHVPWQALPKVYQAEKIPELTDALHREATRILENNTTMSRRLDALADTLEKCASGVMYGKLDADVKNLLEILNEKNGNLWIDDPTDAPLTYWKGCSPPPALNPLLRQAFRHIRAAALRQCRAKNLAVFGLIKEYDQIYGKYVRSAGNITFSDIPALLTAMDEDTRQIILGPEDHSLEFRLDRKIQHYLFDEFQDTSDVQMQVFDPLLKELFSQLDPDKFRSFFCVGDLKQSIYQWRGGNPELFNYITNLLRTISEHLGYDPSNSLVCSYRSSQAVLDTVNAVFTDYSGDFGLFRQILPRMRFEAHISSDQAMPGHTALINVAQKNPQSAQNHPAKSAIINSILQEIRPLQRGLTVGVLVATNAVAQEFAEELKSKYHLPVSVDGKISPVDSMAVVLFRQLLIRACHPGDQEAEKFLEMICFASPQEESKALTDAELAEKLLYSPQIPLDEALREDIFVNGLAGFARRFTDAFAAECTVFDRTRMNILCDAAASFDGTCDEFISQLHRLGKSDNSLDGTIQIMTSHKAKGLEFDIVFMPDLTNHNHNEDSYLPESEIIHYDEKEWIDTVQAPRWVSYLPNKVISGNIPLMDEHLENKEKEHLLEKCCTLYVGMTRAKSALYLLTSRNNISGVFAPDKLLMEQLPLYGVQNSDTELKELLSTEEMAEFKADLQFSHGDWHWYIKSAPEILPVRQETAPAACFPVVKTAAVPKERLASGEKSVEFVTDTAQRFNAVNGKNIGTEVHELFEKIHFITDDFDAEKFAVKENASPVAVEIFSNALAENSAIRKALTAPADGSETEVWCEKRFLLRNHANEIIPGAFDRVVIHKENGIPVRADIFDYKSDRMTSAEEFAVYFPQLRLYRESLCILLDLPPEKISCTILALKIKEAIMVD